MFKLGPWYATSTPMDTAFEQLKQNPVPLLIALVVALIAAVYVHRQSLERNAIDIVSNRRITALYTYPIKSFRGIRVATSTLSASGLAYDRIYTLATRHRRTGEYNALTAYDNTAVARFTVEFIPSSTSANEPTHIQIRVLNGDDTSPTLALPLHANVSALKIVPFQVFDANAMNAYDMGDEIASFFEPFKLQAVKKDEEEQEVRVLYKGPMVRTLSGHGAQYKDGETAFANYLPLLVANEASLEDLNARMREGDTTGARMPMSMERFRPNIVVSGEGGAWEEDDWRQVMMGDNIRMDVVSRCVRCSVPCIDPETGVKDKMEPSRTLSRFRRIDAGAPSKTCFGMLSVPRAMGVVSVGDVVQVARRGDHHYVKGY